jgi:hypothetical protein
MLCAALDEYMHETSDNPATPLNALPRSLSLIGGCQRTSWPQSSIRSRLCRCEEWHDAQHALYDYVCAHLLQFFNC